MLHYVLVRLQLATQLCEYCSGVPLQVIRAFAGVNDTNDDAQVRRGKYSVPRPAEIVRVVSVLLKILGQYSSYCK